MFSTTLRHRLPEQPAIAIVGASKRLSHLAVGRSLRLPENRTLDISTSLTAYWYFHLPNFVMAALMYTMLGRFLLGLMVDADSPNYVWRFFCRITDPVIAAVSIVTPRITHPAVVWLFGFVWMFWLRVAFHYTLLLLNLAPRLGGAAS